MKDVSAIEMRAWGRSVGAVTLDPKPAYYAFEYESTWKRNGAELAPLQMPLKGSHSSNFEINVITYDSSSPGGI